MKSVDKKTRAPPPQKKDGRQSEFISLVFLLLPGASENRDGAVFFTKDGRDRLI